MGRIELPTSPLPRECSTTEPHGLGAGEGNRTLVLSLEGFCSTIELHPLRLPADCRNWWREKDSNLRRQSRQIYSLLPLTARESLQKGVIVNEEKIASSFFKPSNQFFVGKVAKKNINFS